MLLAMRPASKNSTQTPSPELPLYSTVGTQKRTEFWNASSPAVRREPAKAACSGLIIINKVL